MDYDTLRPKNTSSKENKNMKDSLHKVHFVH